MKNILLSAVILISQLTFAGDPPVSLKGQGTTAKNIPAWNLEVPFQQSTKTGGINALIETGNTNMLPNPGFEHSTYSTSWTAGADATISKGTTTNVGTGNASMGMITTNVSTNYVDSTTITIPPGYYGVNAEVSCWFNATEGYGGGTGAQIMAYDGTNFYGQTGIPAGSGRTTGNFVMPSSGNIRLRVFANTASLPIEYFDDCYLGPARNITSVAQAALIGSAYIPTASNCSWTRASSTMGAFGTDADCSGPTVDTNTGPGTISLTNTNLPKFTVNNLPAGQYKVTMSFTAYTGTSATDAGVAISDGTSIKGYLDFRESNASNDITPFTTVGVFTYSSSGNRSFEVYGAMGSGTITLRNDSAYTRVSFSIERWPSANEQVTSVSRQSAPTVQRLTSGSSATYTTPAGVTHLRVRMIGGGGGSAGSGTTGGSSAGAGADSTFGNLTSGGGGLGQWNGSGGAGGSATVGPGWTNIASASGNGGGGWSGGVAVGNIFNGGYGGASFFGGAPQGDAYTGVGRVGIANTGAGASGGGTNNVANSVPGAGGGSGAYVEATISNPAATYTYTVGAGGTAGGAGGSGLAGAVGGSGIIIVDEYYGANVPLLIGSVTSNSNGLERIERATIASGCASVTSQSGSWLSVSSGGTGVCNATFGAGIFSSTPTCTCSARRNSGGGPAICIPSVTVSNTSAIFNTISDGGGTAANFIIDVICMGPR